MNTINSFIAIRFYTTVIRSKLIKLHTLLDGVGSFAVAYPQELVTRKGLFSIKFDELNDPNEYVLIVLIIHSC